MSQAVPFIRLSAFIRNPFVRAAFERAEKGGGDFTVPANATPKKPVLTGGEAKKLAVVL